MFETGQRRRVEAACIQRAWVGTGEVYMDSIMVRRGVMGREGQLWQCNKSTFCTMLHCILSGRRDMEGWRFRGLTEHDALDQE